MTLDNPPTAEMVARKFDRHRRLGERASLFLGGAVRDALVNAPDRVTSVSVPLPADLATVDTPDFVRACCYQMRHHGYQRVEMSSGATLRLEWA